MNSASTCPGASGAAAKVARNLGRVAEASGGGGGIRPEVSGALRPGSRQAGVSWAEVGIGGGDTSRANGGDANMTEIGVDMTRPKGKKHMFV